MNIIFLWWIGFHDKHPCWASSATRWFQELKVTLDNVKDSHNFQILKTLPLIYLLLSPLFLAILSNSYPNSQSDNMYFTQTSKCQKLTFLVCGVDLDYKWHHSVRLSCDKVLINVWLWNILADEEIASNWRVFFHHHLGVKRTILLLWENIWSLMDKWSQ